MCAYGPAMGRRNVFLSRWMALAWAAGIVWFALEVSSPGETVAVGNNQQEVTDITGAPVTNQQVKEIEDTIANL